TRTHRVQTLDSFGYLSASNPDLRWGTVADTVDVNGQCEHFDRDQFGRLTRVFGPNEVGREAFGACSMAPTGTPAIEIRYGTDSTITPRFPAWALTRHLDIRADGALRDPADPTIDTVSFIDGYR